MAELSNRTAHVCSDATRGKIIRAMYFYCVYCLYIGLINAYSLLDDCGKLDNAFLDLEDN